MGATQNRNAAEAHPFPQIDQILLTARQNGLKGDLREAEALYSEAERQSRTLHYIEGEARALTGLGSCQFGSFAYRKALRSFLAARDLARKLENPILAGSISGNLASLYIDLGSLPEAAQEIDRSIHFLSRAKEKPGPDALLHAYLIKADILFKQAKPSEGRLAAEQTIALARQLRNERFEAFAWIRLAELVLFEKYDAPLSLYEEADRYLKTAAKLQAKVPFDGELAFAARTDEAYVDLCLGNPKLALETLDGAIKAAPASNLTRSYEAPHTKGLILAELGRTSEALTSLRDAVRRADQWRSGALPGDVSSTATVAQLHSIYSDYSNLAAATGLVRRDEALIRDALEVLAWSRAANLREQVAVYLQQLDRLPAEYYSLIRQLNAAQAKTLSDPGGADESSAQQIRAQLSLLQDQAGLRASGFSKDRERKFHQKSLRDIQRSLGNEDLLLSFSLGKKMTDTSYLWATTADSVNLYPIGSRQAVETEAAQFKTAVRFHRDSSASGGRLCSLLFSKLPAEMQFKRHWLLVPDGELLDGIPWAALPDPGKGSSVSLISRRDVRTLPSEFLVDSRQQTLNDTFVGVGDPIYNHADPRLGAGQKAITKPAKPLGLARLAGSQVEVDHASRAWNKRVLLMAGQATLDGLKTAIEQQSPGVLHFAVHVLSPDNHPEQAALVLSLTSNGLPELLTPEIISTLKVPGSVVILSGCASQRGKVMPGAGLIGLSRAWLLAGASAVVVSAWPTPDDSGRFFEVFYSSLKRHDPTAHSVVEKTASALRDAQLEMQRDPGFRNSPEYWAAYSVISKE